MCASLTSAAHAELWEDVKILRGMIWGYWMVIRDLNEVAISHKVVIRDLNEVASSHDVFRKISALIELSILLTLT